MAPQPCWARHRVLVALRRVVSLFLRDLAMVGASFCGNAELLTAIRNDRSPATDGAASRSLDREIADGIAEIEGYLAGRGRGLQPRPPRSDSPPRRSQRGTGST